MSTLKGKTTNKSLTSLKKKKYKSTVQNHEHFKENNRNMGKKYIIFFHLCFNYFDKYLIALSSFEAFLCLTIIVREKISLNIITPFL